MRSLEVKTPGMFCFELALKRNRLTRKVRRFCAQTTLANG
jgi:hypothetical protein